MGEYFRYLRRLLGLGLVSGSRVRVRGSEGGSIRRGILELPQVFGLDDCSQGVPSPGYLGRLVVTLLLYT